MENKLFIQRELLWICQDLLVTLAKPKTTENICKILEFVEALENEPLK